MASITSATSGPSNVGSTWTGGVVPVVGDKVTIAHPGTNAASSTLYQLNGARSAGDTSIPVDTGTGTIVAGECIQVLHQTGTDARGRPIYDNKYYKVATGISAAGTLVIDAPGLTYAVADNVQIVNRGHVVELAATHTWGDDTSSTTVASNAIVVTGALKGSRSTNWSLTCRGSLHVNDGGVIDWGATGDIIPAGVTGTVILNDSAALAAGKHGAVSNGRTLPLWRIRGVLRTRNTRLTSGISAGATSITVDASAGWAVGDRIVLASDTDDPTRAQVVVISGGSSPTWTVPAITNARLAGCRVGNLSSNVTVKSMAAASPGYLSFTSSTQTGAFSRSRVTDVGDFRAEDIGAANGGLTHGNTPAFYGVALSISTAAPEYVERVAFEGSNSASTRMFSHNSLAAADRVFDDCAGYTSGSSEGCYLGQASTGGMTDTVIYRSTSAAYTSAYGQGSQSSVIRGGAAWASSSVVTVVASASLRFTDGFEGHTPAAPVLYQTGSVEFDGCSLFGARAIAAGASYTASAAKYTNCTLSSGVLTGANNAGSLPAQGCEARITAANGDASDNRVLGWYQATVTDSATRKRSTYSVKIQPKVANTAITYVFALPAIAGVAQIIKGSLRFDATYGTATPPSIVLSGQGVTQSYTCAAVADAWGDFSFTFTPTSTGDITATVTVQSASTSGFAWLDGVYHYPMTQSVRHFGYIWQPQAAQVADSSITVSEAIALAYPVSVNHATDTITLSGNVTARQIYEACMADLVQTANQGEAKHISTSDLGASFTTTYAVDVGAFSVTGPYTDSAGLHVNIRADNLLTGSRVQLYNVTDSTELLNTVTSGAGLVYPIVAPGTAKTIRLRVAKVGYLPIEAFGVLSGGSVSFLDSQVVDAVYNAIGIDGSTVTEFTPDYPNLQIDSDDADGQTQVQRVYAWSRWANTAADGIRLMHNAVQAQDSANFLIDVAIVDARFDNVSATPLVISGGLIRRSDGTTVIGNGSIQMDPGRAYVAQGAAAITVPAGERVVTLASSGGYMARG